MIKKNILNINANNSIFKKNISLFFYTLVLFFSFLTIFSISKANNVFDNGSNINFRVIPEAIGPNEDFTVSLSSSSFDINRAKTKVFIDGKKVLDGYSIKTFKSKTKDNGKEVVIRVESIANDGLLYKTEMAIIPADVDLIYESVDGYRPPFYKGGAEVLSDARVKVVALPELYENTGKKIATSDLIYTWKVDFKKDLANSGYGKNYYYIDRITASPINTKIKVRVETKDGKLYAEKRVTIKPKNAKIFFYLQDSASDYKLINPISNGVMETENNNIFIRTVPYFMNEIGNMSKISNSWFINGQEQKESEGMDIINIDNDSSNGRQLKIRFQKIIRNAYRPLQYASDKVTVEFEKVQREVYNLRERNKSNNSDPIGRFFK